ncbi:FMN-dependent NADH-azoreductase 1 [Mortierella sp. GBA39]|nr:FMN-dependent NADH-azoreductase 1 [Mortierella sp. GBA39]
MSDILRQFKSAKRYVIAMPLHNFNIPSKLKDYMDNILIAKETFAYTDKGSIGLLTDGRNVVVIQASDGIYTNQDWYTEVEYSHRYLKSMFNFMGVDYQIIRAQGNHSLKREEVLAKAFQEAESAAASLAHQGMQPETADAGQTPETAAIQAESVSYALLVLLEQLSPVERAVFILRETLDYDYRDIAELLDKSDANCRKLYSRAKQKVSTAPVPGREERAAAEPPIAVPVESTRVTSDQAKHAELLSRAFMAAANSGDFREFVGMLADDARLYTDGGGKVRSAIFPIIGSNRILAFLQGIAPGNIKPENQLLIDVNGQPGLRLNRGDELFAVLSFQFDSDSRPVRMFMVTNPDKLKHVTP